MKTSPQGLAALALFEGLKLEAYRDSVGVWTIGVGHTAMAGPPKPVAGMKITRQEALDILARDLPQYEAAVEKRMPQVPQWVFDGAVSFCFNLGAGNFAKASWVAKYAEGHFAEAEASFKSWNKAGGKVLKGLITRRGMEADMVFRNRYPDGRSFSLAPATHDQPVFIPAEPKPPPPDIPVLTPRDTNIPQASPKARAAVGIGAVIIAAIAGIAKWLGWV